MAVEALIDVDVHNALKTHDDLKRYLPKRWHLYYDQGITSNPYANQVVGARPQAHFFRGDVMPEEGPGGSDLELMREQLLDRYDVRKAIVHPIAEVLSFLQYGELGLALAAAMNDLMVEKWLERDDRLYGAITVPTEDGTLAAREIERAAEHPRFVKVLLPMAVREGFGHSKYWPIYEVAAAKGLPVAAHVGGFSGTHLANGFATYHAEHVSGQKQPYTAQVVSLVYSGVFERFPSLQFVFEEGGFAWMPSLMWRLDSSWAAMREQVPHLTEPPSAVIRRHCWFATQPLDEPEQPEYLLDLFRQLDMDDRVMFSSDYPHWDFDDPRRVLAASLIGRERREKIMAANAERCFRFA